MTASGSIAVILLCGLPASGKSTLARQLCASLGNGGESNVHCIEYDVMEDNLWEKVEDSKDEEKRREIWNQARQSSLQQLQSLIAAHKEQQSTKSTTWKKDLIVLLDDNFHLRGMRKQIHRSLVSVDDARFGIIYVMADAETCRIRNSKRPRPVPSHVIDNMNQSFEIPCMYWETLLWAGEIGEFPANTIDHLCAKVLSCPAIVPVARQDNDEIDEGERRRTIDSQKLDMLLRDWVGRTAKWNKNYAAKANAARKQIVKEKRQVDGILSEQDLLYRFIDMVVDGTGGDRDQLLKALCAPVP